MDPLAITILFFGSLILVLALGLPVAFALGALGLAGTILVWPQGLYQLSTTAYHTMSSFTFVAVPLFIIMAEFLSQSGIADDIYGAVQIWFGRLPGGLASATIGASAVFGAISGSSAAGTATMGTVALGPMLRRGYNPELATGTICAGGALSSLIPPSIIMILYGAVANESVGQLFMGGVFPGILLSGIFIAYITIRCSVDKSLGPPGPASTMTQRLVSLRKLIPAVLLVAVVLGSIYSGLATPTEASAFGAVGSLAIVAVYRRLNWPNFKHAVLAATKTSCMVLWIVIGAISFVHFITFAGLSDVVTKAIVGLPLGPWGIMIAMQLILIVLGCFLDPLGILYITTPIFLPIVHELGFSPLWYGVLFTVNMELAFITPPFGFNLFIMKTLLPKEISMAHVYRGIISFTLLDMAGLGLVMAFPQLALWLPGTMIK